MKKIINFTLICLFTAIASQKAWAKCEKPYSSIVFVEKNGEIISEKRADEIIYPASLTKVMTLYLAFEALERNKLHLKQKLTASARAEEISKVNKTNSLNLKEGDEITVEEAIRAATVKSFNEATIVLAESIAGDEWGFAKLMNKKAKELNMQHTNFRNASGLHDVGQYTTNYDLARLVMAIEKNFPQYRHYFAEKSFVYNKVKYKSHNHVLLEFKGADGFKTGYTAASGFNLIASAKRKGTPRISSIVTGCESAKRRDDFTKALLTQSFEELPNLDKELVVAIK